VQGSESFGNLELVVARGREHRVETDGRAWRKEGRAMYCFLHSFLKTHVASVVLKEGTSQRKNESDIQYPPYGFKVEKEPW
jgi:hypothetical protein